MAQGLDQPQQQTSRSLRLAGHTVDVDAVTHRYGANIALDEVSLAIRSGEIMALLGPSGCGKTTLLRIIAGFIRQQSGRILVDGQGVDSLPPNLRNVGIVFQSYALFPHMTVAENIAYGLHARRRPKAEVRDRVAKMIDVVRLGGMADRLPRQLSGGQQQRVALARVLAVEPSVLLLDEPFSALDKSLRLDMQIEIKRLQREFGLTAILVTHDQDEAMSVADRIAVMNKGRIEQCDTPVSIYDRPESLFVSGFIGSMNQFPGTVTASSDGLLHVSLDDGGSMLTTTPSALRVGDRAIVAVRPEQLALYDTAADGLVPVRHRFALPMGSQTIHEFETSGGRQIKAIEPRIGAPRQSESIVWLGLRPKVAVAAFPVAT
jgi:putative spermidine/putrescine transport system ATP-binding protein